MRKFFIATTVSVSLALSGCAGMSDSQKAGYALCGLATIATLALGGRGAGTKAVEIGGACAAVVTVMAMLDKQEQERLREARLRAVESNARVDWNGSQPPATPEAPSTRTQEANVEPPHHKHTLAHERWCEKHKSICEKEDDKRDTKVASTEPPAAASKLASPPAVSSSSGTSTTQVASATGWVIPVRTYVDDKGQTCREMEESATKNGQTRTDKFKACKADSGWVIPQTV